jgi:hypothetical protein
MGQWQPLGAAASRPGRDRFHPARAFAAVDDPAALQAICDRLDSARIDALLRQWRARLPHPFSALDRAAGYRYDLSILQAEFSLTQMLDGPSPPGSSSSR